MSFGKFLLRTIVVAVAMFALGYVGHQLILGPAYSSIIPIMRSQADMQAHMPFALISSLCFSAAFVWIYAQGQSTRPWLGQGLRFGVAVWAIAAVPHYIANYTIEPWPGMFITKILVWEFIAMMTLGFVIAALSRSDVGAKARASGN